jgi:serine/threonine-protein kinase
MSPEPAKPDDLSRIEALYHAASLLPAGERAGFLEQVCAGDKTLRAEVESLLAARDRAAEFLETPALMVAAALSRESPPPSRIGQQIGRYRIVGVLGAGGMGEVYRAEDPRLDREVAIKILPAHLADDPAALTRFKREAKAVAGLSHPNILALHDFDRDGDVHFAVMELLQGETLASRISRAALDWREAVAIAISVASGLAAAHKKGIVHRDIKPDNIFLTSEGQVKILDFGVARLLPDAQAATQTQATRQGWAIGTVGYMAPEQLRGEAVESAADLFALGCVLHEMVTGKRLFARRTAAETVAAILTVEPASLKDAVRGVPSALDDITRRCLRKQSGERFRSAQDLELSLSELAAGNPTPRIPPVWRIGKPRPVVWIPALLLIAFAAALLLHRLARFPVISEESLAILPIANQSGDESLDYVGDGITETLINGMSRLPQLKVMARTSAFRYKGKNVDPQTAGRELKVRRVFTGRLLRQGDVLNIQVDLVNVEDGAELWGGRYNEKPTELLGLPEIMSAKISETLRLNLDTAAQLRLSHRHTQNQEAYRLYLLGRYYFGRRDWNDRDAIKTAIESYQKAIDLDPLFATAYVGLAEAYDVAPTYMMAPQESSLKARASATKALEIDDSIAEAYATLADLIAEDWKWVEAEKGFRKAIELKPGYAQAHYWYALCLERMGREREALEEMRRAYELDPLSPNTNIVLGELLANNRLFDQAIEQFRKTMELNPSSTMTPVHMAVVLLYRKKFPEALAELDHADTLMPGARPIRALRGYAYAKTGRRLEALEILRQLSGPSAPQVGTAFDLPALYLGLGDMDKAFESLNRSVDSREMLIDFLKADIFMEPLRADSRYTALLRRMNLKP